MAKKVLRDRATPIQSAPFISQKKLCFKASGEQKWGIFEPRPWGGGAVTLQGEPMPYLIDHNLI